MLRLFATPPSHKKRYAPLREQGRLFKAHRQLSQGSDYALEPDEEDVPQHEPQRGHQDQGGDSDDECDADSYDQSATEASDEDYSDNDDAGVSNHQDVAAVLDDHGLHGYLTSVGGLQLPSVTAHTVSYRLAKCLCLTYSISHDKASLDPDEAMQWLHSFVTNGYKLIVDYAVYLTDEVRLAPGTVGNSLYDVKKGVNWFVDEVEGMSGVDTAPLFKRITKLTKNLRKAAKKLDLQKSPEIAIANREYPAGGLPELRDLVQASWQQVDNIIQSVQDGAYLRKADYNTIINTLAAALYVLNVQGRKKGFHELKMLQTPGDCLLRSLVPSLQLVAN